MSVNSVIEAKMPVINVINRVRDDIVVCWGRLSLFMLSRGN